jgi:hypothetical protein
VRDAGGKVEHVAGLEHPFLLWHEIRQDLERKARPEREVALAGDAPAPPPAPLEEEDVVAVDVRTDAAARDGIAHHHVVDARVRDEVEAAEEVGGGAREPVRILDQHRPAAAR